MMGDLESRLHRALRPVDPGGELAQRVMRHVVARKRRRVAWMSAALAASVTLVIAYQWQQRERAAGLAARAQVLEALRVTTDKLDLASRLVNTG